MAQSDFTIADVLEWARTKPADEEYDLNLSDQCALAQFGKATDRLHLVDCFDPDIHYPGLGLNYALGFDRNCETTFGALVSRLETLCPATPVTQSNWSAIDAYLSDIEAVSA